MSGEQKDNGFGVVTKDVALDPAISTMAKAVYLVLAVHRNTSTGQCTPRRATIMKALGISEATVKRAMNELVTHGVVERQARFADGRQTTNQYVLIDAVAHRKDLR